MPFENVNERIISAHRAAYVRRDIQEIYTQCKRTAESLQQYQAATDPVFNGTVNAIYTATERTALAAMLTDMQNLVATWETSYADVLGIVSGE